MSVTTEPATTAPATVDPDMFRSLLRRQASTVTVVTAPGLPPAGFTATSFTSVSLRPPIVSVCLSRDASTWPTVARTRYLAVHLLAEGQQHLARTFSTSGIDRFADRATWRYGPYDVPILEGTRAWLLREVVDRVIVGDHAVVLAQALLAGYGTDGTPLLYHDGRYARVAPTGPPATSVRSSR